MSDKPADAPKPKIGRPSKYTEELASLICQRIADGESLRRICDDDDMPGQNTVRVWLQTRDAFRAQYARAREDQADTFAGRILDEANSATDGEGAQVARVRIDALKWLAGKLRPKVYGDKVTQEHTGEGGGPVRVTWQG